MSTVAKRRWKELRCNVRRLESLSPDVAFQALRTSDRMSCQEVRTISVSCQWASKSALTTADRSRGGEACVILAFMYGW